jgi:CheY-like chemotaxis protein
VRIRIKQTLSGTIDGIDLSRFIEGFTYEVGTDLGNVLLAEGWAEPVETAAHPTEPSVVIPISLLQRPTVLIVEDDEDFREIVAETLRYHGFHVVGARDGREGLAALEKHRPALVVLDLNLPSVTGRQFRDAQQRLPDRSLARVPVVVVSARDDAAAQGRAMRASATFQKPVDMGTLVTTIQRQVGGRGISH